MIPEVLEDYAYFNANLKYSPNFQFTMKKSFLFGVVLTLHTAIKYFPHPILNIQNI